LGRSALLLLLALSLGGCGLARRAELEKQMVALKEQSQAATEACRAKPLTSYVERAKCLNDAAQIARPTAPYPDLLDVLLAQRVEIASRVDKKMITPEEGQLEYAKVVSQATTESQQRSLAGRSVAAQEQSAAAASQAAWAASMPVSCSKFGNTVTCF
jgi:hypothetical protein